MKSALIAFLCFFISTTYADELESFDNLNTAAQQFIHQQINLDQGDSLEVNISNSARNLSVAKCQEPIQVSLPADTNKEQINTLIMSCNLPVAWKVYVPVTTRILTDMVITKQPVSARQEITADMLDYAQNDKTRATSGYYKRVDEVVGQIATTTIPSGTVINQHIIQHPIAIKRNQNVTIVAKNGYIMVKAEGIAKSDGAINDIIKVMNSSSKKMLDATVINSSTVEVAS